MSKFFKVDARAILTWGRDSIKDHTTAVIELVKNSYDAGATVVEIEIKASSEDRDSWFIRISDNGAGMTEEQVETNWLRIGYSEKRKDKLIRNRRKVGEKGIGRISSDRLGATLELRSQAKNEQPVGLKVEWDKFDVAGTDLGTVPIQDIDKVRFSVPSPLLDEKDPEWPSGPNSKSVCGTELLIRDLRQSWSVTEIADLYEELAALTPPFESVVDFQIRLINDVDVSANGVVRSPFSETAEIDGEFEYKGGSSINFALADRDLKGKYRTADKGKVEWEDFIHQTPPKSSKKHLSEPRFGPVTVRLMFFLRDSDALRGSKLSLTELREFLDKNMGIKIYRDLVRVKPYGTPSTPEGDWLGLGERRARDPAGAGRSSYKIAPSQLVGAVFLTRDSNPDIADSASREGLIQGDAFNELKAFILGCVMQLENHHHRRHLEREKDKPVSPPPAETVMSLRDDLKELAENLRMVQDRLPPKAGRHVDRSLDQIRNSMASIQAAKKSIDELASQSTIYRTLATVGIAAATFGHETQTSIEEMLSPARACKAMLEVEPIDIKGMVEELDKSIAAAARVATWGDFALKRIKRDKRKRRQENIDEIVKEIIEEMQPALNESDITVDASAIKPVKGTILAMDIESCLINLVTNAYTFCQLKNRNRVIAVRLREANVNGQRGMELVVADSGPGVSKKFVDRIWEPLFTTKVNEKGEQSGTGLGLAIVQSIVDDFHGTRTVDEDPVLHGARFKIWLPL
jgi:signal transduction histidine kinase